MQPRVNKWLDLLDRAGWTAIQAISGALLVVLTGADFSWETGVKFVIATTLVAVVKVIVGQNTGSDDTGSLIGTSVIQPPPEA